MLIYSLSSLLLLMVWSFALANSIWKAEFFASETNATPISSLELIKGLYTPVFVKFSLNEGEKLERLTGSLELTPGTEVQLSDKISIDTYKERFIKVFIGISCQATNTDYTLEFNVNGGTSTVSFTELTITVSINKATVNVTPLVDTIPIDGYGIYEINQDTFNVDNINIEFNPKGDIESMDVPAFSMQRKKLLQKKFLANGQSTQYSYKVAEMENCFDPKDFHFTMAQTAEPQEPIKKPEIVKSFNYEIIDKTKLQISMKLPKGHILLTCGAFFSHLEAEKIIDITNMENYENQNPNFRWKRIIKPSTEETETKLEFENLNRIGAGYEIKCHIERCINSLKEGDFISIIIGNYLDIKYDSIKKITLDLPSPSQCGIWTFKTTIDSFLEAAKEYCEKTIAQHHINSKINNLNENGCVQCEHYILSPPNAQYGICIRSSEECNTNFSSNAFFKAFLQLINTKGKISEQLNIPDVPDVVSVIQYNDDFELNKANIASEIISEVSEGKTKFSMKIKNSLPRDVECQTVKTLRTSIDINKILISDGFLFTLNKVIPAEKDETFDIEFENNAEDKYEVVLQCFNLPNYQKRYHKYTFLSFVAINTQKEITRYPDVAAHNCSEKELIFTGQCITFSIDDIILETDISIDDIEKDLFEFNTLSLGHKEVYLKILQNQLTTTNGNKEILNKIIQNAKLLYALQCKETKNYQECRKIKQTHFSFLHTKLKSTFAPDENFVGKIEEIDKEKGGLLLAYVINELSKNPESYDNTTTYIEYPKLASDYINKMPNIIEKMSNTNQIKYDIAKLLLGYFANGLKYIKFLNNENGTIPVDNVGLYTDPKIIQMKNDFEIIQRIFADAEIDEYSHEHIFIKYLQKTNIDTVSNFVQNEDVQVNITIPQYIYGNTSSDLIGLFLHFDDYPLFSEGMILLTKQVYGIRFYKDKKELHNDTELNADCKIKVNFTLDGEHYKLFRFNKIFTSFDYSNIGSGDFYSTVGVVEIGKDGDYLMGRNEGSVTWMIVTFSIVGSILIAGIAYFIYANVKRRTQNTQIDSVAPILQG